MEDHKNNAGEHPIDDGGLAGSDHNGNTDRQEDLSGSETKEEVDEGKILSILTGHEEELLENLDTNVIPGFEEFGQGNDFSNDGYWWIAGDAAGERDQEFDTYESDSEEEVLTPKAKRAKKIRLEMHVWLLTNLKDTAIGEYASEILQYMKGFWEATRDKREDDMRDIVRQYFAKKDEFKNLRRCFKDTKAKLKPAVEELELRFNKAKKSYFRLAQMFGSTEQGGPEFVGRAYGEAQSKYVKYRDAKQPYLTSIHFFQVALSTIQRVEELEPAMAVALSAIEEA